MRFARTAARATATRCWDSGCSRTPRATATVARWAPPCAPSTPPRGSTSRGSPTRAFKRWAVATAYNLAKEKLRHIPAVRRSMRRWARWLGHTRLDYIGRNSYENKHLVDALAVLELQRTGLRSKIDGQRDRQRTPARPQQGPAADQPGDPAHGRGQVGLRAQRPTVQPDRLPRLLVRPVRAGGAPAGAQGLVARTPRAAPARHHHRQAHRAGREPGLLGALPGPEVDDVRDRLRPGPDLPAARILGRGRRAQQGRCPAGPLQDARRRRWTRAANGSFSRCARTFYAGCSASTAIPGPPSTRDCRWCSSTGRPRTCPAACSGFRFPPTRRCGRWWASRTAASPWSAAATFGTP